MKKIAFILLEFASKVFFNKLFSMIVLYFSISLWLKSIESKSASWAQMLCTCHFCNFTSWSAFSKFEWISEIPTAKRFWWTGSEWCNSSKLALLKKILVFFEVFQKTAGTNAVFLSTSYSLQKYHFQANFR